MADGPNRLRIGLVCPPGWRLEAWQARILDRIEADPRLEIAGRIEGEEASAAVALPRLAETMLRVERLATRLRFPSPALSGAQARLDRLPLLRAGEAKVDLALTLGTAALSRRQLGMARGGEWSLRFAGARPPADWLWMTAEQRRSGLIGVELLVRDAVHPEAQVIARTAYNPKPTAALSGAFVAEKSALFLLKALGDLASGRPLLPQGGGPAAPPAPPGAAEVLRYGVHVAHAAARRLTDRLRERAGRGRDFWQLAAGRGGVLDFDPGQARALDRQAFVMADPFLFENDGELYLFYEAQNADNRPAWIEVARLEGERLVPLGTALRRDYHLSFPFVFRDGAQIYMMPETQQTQRLEVWRATRFPLEWELHAVGLEGQFPADSTLLKHDGRWWLFTNLSDHAMFQEHSSELYLFCCDGPSLGNLTPHPQNPVAIGSAHARNAGAVIVQEGRLFRPSQNNSHGVYGYGLNIMEIERLDPAQYRERLVRRFTPADRPGSRGLHHVTFARGRFVLDWSGR
jgi:hypothetical protein